MDIYILQQTTIQVIDEQTSVTMSNVCDDAVASKEHAAKEYPTEAEYSTFRLPEMLQFEGQFSLYYIVPMTIG